MPEVIEVVYDDSADVVFPIIYNTARQIRHTMVVVAEPVARFLQEYFGKVGVATNYHITLGASITDETVCFVPIWLRGVCVVARSTGEGAGNCRVVSLELIQ